MTGSPPSDAWDWIVVARESDMAIQVTYPDGDEVLFVTGGYSAHGHAGLDWIRLGSHEGFVTSHTVANAIGLCDPDVRLREAERAIAERETAEAETV